MDERLDALLEDVTDALKEVVASIDGLIQSSSDLQDADKKRLDKNNLKIQEVLSLIGFVCCRASLLHGSDFRCMWIYPVIYCDLFCDLL